MNIDDIKKIINEYEKDQLPIMLKSFCIVDAINNPGNLFHNVEHNKSQMNNILKPLDIKLKV